LEPFLPPAVTRVLLAAIALAALAGCDRKKQEAEQPRPASVVPAPPQGGTDRSHKGEAAPAIPFERPGGGPATLATFRGRPLLLNLWATWCAPCVVELPALDRLAEANKGRFRFVAVSQDIAGMREVGPFLAGRKLANVEPYLDKENVLMAALKAETLPVTILYDAKGRELWRVTGKMDWTGPEAAALIEEGLAAK
jgi:thiol-disulfide isomerase/thioredoxin